jgi:phosphoribosylformylglycinamidine synthase
LKISVITYPGSNCDADAAEVFALRGHKVSSIWHKDTSLNDPDLLIIPGGFSYGDYCVAALWREAPRLQRTPSLCRLGGMILGICNGFRYLPSWGLLPAVF